MPTYYAYESSSGGYIQTQIDDSPQTLQVAPSAQVLLSELGYEYDEYVPRDVTKLLVIIGVLTTKPYGPSKFELLDGMPALATDYCELDAEQQSQLRAYLEERTADLSVDDYEYLRQFLKTESPLDIVSRPDADDHATRIDHSSELTTKVDLDSVTIESIPTRLRKIDQWLCWRIETRDGKETKVPVSPHDGGFASVDNPSTWASFDVAVEAAQRDEIAGLGFVFTDKDTIAGIDLDDMRNPENGTLTDRAEAILNAVGSYTEVSPSGTGLHVLLRGFLPEGRQRQDGIEIYDSGRFFTVTGDQIDTYPDQVAVRHDELQSIHEEYVARDEDSQPTCQDSSVESNPTVSDMDKTEAEIIEYGKRKPKFRRLWNGNTSGYKSHSEADLAMCVLLAYYTGDNRRLMDSVFRQSGLMRDKWDEQRGDQTYGELTIDEAIRIVDTYDPHLHGMDAASPQEAIGQLEPGQKATIEATVVSVESVPTGAIEQAGELQDETGKIRFVVWSSEYWDPDVHLSKGDTYRIADGWIDEYQGQRQIQINEHTAVEKMGASTEASQRD